MIAKNIKNAVDIQKNGKRVLNVIKNGKVVYYYIPDSYVELEYIENPSTAYIDTGIIANLAHSTIICKYDPSKLGSDRTQRCLFGVGPSWNVQRFAYGIYTDSAQSWYTYPSSTPSYEGRLSNINSVIYDKGKLYLNNVIMSAGTPTDGYTYKSIYLFAYNYISGVPGIYCSNVPMHYIIFKYNDIIVGNFIPVRRLGDAICGMYDTITQIFHPSESIIQFKGGPIKTVKNEHYIESPNGDSLVYYHGYRDRYRVSKSFIPNATNADYQNISQVILCNPNTNKWGVSSMAHTPYTESMYPYNFIRSWYQRVTTNPQYIQNINPNWNILKTSSVDANDFETSNEKLYIGNKREITIVNTVTSNTTPTTETLSTTGMTIYHLPYLNFTGNERSWINIGPIEITEDTTSDLSCNISTDVIPGNTGVVGNQSIINRYFYTSGNRSIIKLGGNNVETFVVKESQQEKVVRFNKTDLYINGVRYIHNLPQPANLFPLFGLGCRLDYNYIPSSAKMIGKLRYYRLERKNSLYRHYLPALLYKEENNIKTLYLGFFESVEQKFYKADSNTLPATNNNATLASDWSNIIDINGAVIPIDNTPLLTPVETIGGNNDDASEIRTLYNKYNNGEYNTDTIIKVISSSGKYIIGSLSSWKESSGTNYFILQFDLTKPYEQDAYTNPTKFSAYLEGGTGIIFIDNNL